MIRNTAAPLLLKGGTLVCLFGELENMDLLILDGRIAGMDPAALPEDTVTLDVSGCHVLPGFIDTHIHGAYGDEVMSGEPEGILRMAAALTRHGVTGFLPTTIAAPHAELLPVIDACVTAQRGQTAALEQTGTGPVGARILGIHLEGPYINRHRKGAQPEEGIRDPDLEQCREYLRRSGGTVRAMTLAPELPDALDLVELLVAERVAVTLGHTDADASTARLARARGANCVTHLFNQMPALHHRQPGLTAMSLLDDSMFVEIITDGIHVAPEMVQLALRLKPAQRVCLITDAIAATGMGDGQFKLGPHDVTVRGGACRLADGTLAGSVHTMDVALRNVQRFTGLPLVVIAQMLSTNPAVRIGLTGTGALQLGNDADLVVLRAGTVQRTLIAGHTVFAEG